MRCALVSAGMLRGTPPRIPRSPFSFAFSFSQLRSTSSAVFASEVPKNVRVTAHELVDDSGYHVVDREAPLPARQFGLENDLEEEVPELFSLSALRSPLSMASMTLARFLEGIFCAASRRTAPDPTGNRPVRGAAA